MSDELKQPIVTEDDVLAGSKSVSVLTRKGERRTIIVNAMPWRTALHSSFCGMGDAMVEILENSVAREQQKQLNDIVPVHLVWLGNVAYQLTNGVDALKKAPALTNAAPSAPEKHPGQASTPPSAT